MIDLSVPEGQTEKGNKLDLSQKAEPVSEFGFTVRRREHKYTASSCASSCVRGRAVLENARPPSEIPPGRRRLLSHPPSLTIQKEAWCELSARSEYAGLISEYARPPSDMPRARAIAQTPRYVPPKHVSDGSVGGRSGRESRGRGRSRAAQPRPRDRLLIVALFTSFTPWVFLTILSTMP